MSSAKKTSSTSNPFEQEFGYHRAVRKGPFIFVSGTIALKSSQELEADSESVSKVQHPTDANEQAQLAMQRCVDAVQQLGGEREDVVRVRMFVSRREDCAAVGAAYRHVFVDQCREGGAGSAATMIVVPGGFVDPDIVVEVEVDALC